MAVGQEVLVSNEANLCLTMFSTSIMQMNGSSALLQQHRALRMADMAAVMWSCLAIHFLPKRFLGKQAQQISFFR